MTTNLKRTIFTVLITVLSFPLWKWVATIIVQPKDYVPEGEKGTEMVSNLGTIFVLTLLMAIALLLFYYISGKVFKDR